MDLVVTAERLQFGDRLLKDSRVQALFFDELWLLPKLETRLGASHLAIQGAWLGNEGRTKVRMDFATEDFGRWLRDVGVYPSMRGGRGSVHGTLAWPGRPLDFAGDRMNGSLSLAMEEGEVEELYFLSKALSTLNVLDWPALVGRGFADVAHSGLVFRSLKGAAAIEDGQLDLQGLTLESAPLRLTMGGGLDLGARTYDLDVHVQPLQTLDKLVAAVPLVGYLLTGEKKTFATLDYHVVGPWSEPKVAGTDPGGEPDFMEVLVDRIRNMEWKDLAPWR